MKHKHAELIKAWADGAKIQILYTDDPQYWEDRENPTWHPESVYRIKPDTSFDIVLYISSSVPIGTRSNERKSHHNVKLTYDGVTGDIKSSEILK